MVGFFTSQSLWEKEKPVSLGLWHLWPVPEGQLPSPAEFRRNKLPRETLKLAAAGSRLERHRSMQSGPSCTILNHSGAIP